MKRILLAAAAVLLAASPATAQVSVGSFTFAEQKDPITDANSSALWTEEANGGFMPATLIFKCENDEVGMLLKGTGFYIHEELPVIWRFDQQEPQQGSWRVAEVQWLIPPFELQEALTTTARTANRLAVRVTEGDGGVKTYIFNLNGFSRGMEMMGCGA
jgi:hypothetical protein